jgi:hypothetical protein
LNGNRGGFSPPFSGRKVRDMKTARNLLILGLCSLLLISFSIILVQKSFAEEITITGIVRSGKLWIDKEPYKLTGPYAEEVAKMTGQKVEVTGRVDRENGTIEVMGFRDLGSGL